MIAPNMIGPLFSPDINLKKPVSTIVIPRNIETTKIRNNFTFVRKSKSSFFSGRKSQNLNSSGRLTNFVFSHKNASSLKKRSSSLIFFKGSVRMYSAWKV